MIRPSIRLSIASVSLVWAAAIRAAAAQASASATAFGTATIIQGMSITNTNSLRFGPLGPGILGGTATVSTGGTISATGSITLLTSPAFPTGPATFALLGAPNFAYSITLPTSATLTLQGGASTILVSAFTSNPKNSGTLNVSGTGTLTVGGTITISSSQAAGIYSGSFTVTLSYQ